jgi:trans-resveratrol di-O-methyltransferase
MPQKSPGALLLMRYVLMIYEPEFRVQNLMHHFNDEQCIKILGNCRQALPADGSGKLVIFDPVQMRCEFGGGCETLGFTYEQDLLMQTQRVRSEEQWRKLLGDGGFPKVQFVSFLPRHLLIEASY